MKKCKSGYYWCYTDKKCKKIPLGWHVGRGGIIEKDEEEKNGDNKNGSGNGNGGSDGGSDGGSVSEEAVSKAQQRFFGMVRAVQKGRANIGGDVAKAAASMKKKDVKDFASTKHKGLPEKKKVEEAYYGGEEQRKKDEKKAAYEKQLKKMLPKRAFDSMGRELDPRSGKLKEAHDNAETASRLKRYSDEKKVNYKKDMRMKHGKNWKEFSKQAKEAKNRLRPGEVKKWDKEKKKWVSNRD